MQVARGVEALPELAFAARALAEAHIGELVAFGVTAGQQRPAHDVATGLRATDGGDALTPGRARLAHDVEPLVAPVRRHLAPARARVLGRAHGLQEHLERRDAEAEAQR